MGILDRLLKRNPFAPEPVVKDWSAFARESGKRSQFIEGLATQPISFLSVPQNLPVSPPSNGDDLLSQVENQIAEVFGLIEFLPFVYPSSTGQQTLPILSSSRAITDFMNKSDFAKQGFYAWNLLEQPSPAGLLTLIKFKKTGIKILLNPYSKYSWEISTDDLAWAIQYRETNQLSMEIEDNPND